MHFLRQILPIFVLFCSSLEFSIPATSILEKRINEIGANECQPKFIMESGSPTAQPVSKNTPSNSMDAWTEETDDLIQVWKEESDDSIGVSTEEPDDLIEIWREEPDNLIVVSTEDSDNLARALSKVKRLQKAISCFYCDGQIDVDLYNAEFKTLQEGIWKVLIHFKLQKFPETGEKEKVMKQIELLIAAVDELKGSYQEVTSVKD